MGRVCRPRGSMISNPLWKSFGTRKFRQYEGKVQEVRSMEKSKMRRLVTPRRLLYTHRLIVLSC